MARIPKAIYDARRKVEAFVGDPADRDRRRRRREQSRRGVSKRRAEIWRVEARDISERGAWHEARPHHIVAAFEVFHKWCYGVEPAMTSKDYMGARSAATKMLAADFGDDQAAMVDYMRWLWARERRYEEHRRARGNGGYVMSWRDVFQRRKNLVEYRIDVERKGVNSS